jgi:hypothetical protein
MPDKGKGCFEDGGFRVEVKVISQKGTCEFGHQERDLRIRSSGG